jgi:hypothetical protein
MIRVGAPDLPLRDRWLRAALEVGRLLRPRLLGVLAHFGGHRLGRGGH